MIDFIALESDGNYTYKTSFSETIMTEIHSLLQEPSEYTSRTLYCSDLWRISYIANVRTVEEQHSIDSTYIKGIHGGQSVGL